jgi:hypothetical protein
MMDAKEIQERFIRAAEIGRYREHVGGPARDGNCWLPIIHTQKDMNGWGSERLKEERDRFWKGFAAPQAWEISEAEETLGWIPHVIKKDERRALLAWADCMATKRVFQDWCEREGITRETGRRRKERAILRIMLALTRKPLQHNENLIQSMLHDEPDLVHKTDTMQVWRADDAKPICGFDLGLCDFSWAEAQNAKRRERQANKRARSADQLI